MLNSSDDQLGAMEKLDFDVVVVGGGHAGTEAAAFNTSTNICSNFIQNEIQCENGS